MTDKEKIRREIEKRYEYWREKEHNSHSIESETRMSECQHLLLLFNSLQEEPVSKDLEEAAKVYAIQQLRNPDYPTYNDEYELVCAFDAGAQWQKQQLIDKACEWLKAYRKDSPDGTGYIPGIVNDKSIEEFKQAMEEQQ